MSVLQKQNKPKKPMKTVSFVSQNSLKAPILLLLPTLLKPTPTSISVAISSGDTTEIKIYLGEAVKLETIIVEGKRLPPTISRTEIRGSELLRIPGAANDALKGLTTLPSIGIPNDYFGVLYIRGSEPGIKPLLSRSNAARIPVSLGRFTINHQFRNH